MVNPNAAEHSRPDSDVPGRKRSFLFLQGPLSFFFDRLGRELQARGHRVHKVNLHLGEQLFWRLPATHFRGRPDDWRAFIGNVLAAHEVTDLIMVGDRRPYHLVAAEEARTRGIAVICTDLGYLRPDWITLEYDGMTTYSRFPRDPDAIRALAERFPPPDLRPRYHARFSLVAALDVAFTVPQVLGRPLYPHYRWHGIFHPFAEYGGWLVSLARRRLNARATEAAKARLLGDPGSYFVFPLQLATDFQIRAHSPFADARDAVREVVASYAASGCRQRLVVVVHPLDNGLINWRRLVEGLVRGTRAEDQVIVLEGGIPTELLCASAGIVTINSTVGITALHQNLPVKVLGNAVFDIQGLTFQGRLDRFWHEPVPPNRELTDAFLRALAGTTQVKGGFHERAATARALDGIVRRLEEGLYPLPPLSQEELVRRQVRPPARTVVVTGAASGVGLALARSYAAPGVRLCLIGAPAGALATAATDCRRRGAIVDAPEIDPEDTTAVIAYLDALDRRTPVDVVVAHAGDLTPPPSPGQPRSDRQIVELDLFGAMTSVGALAGRMRRRERGRIAIVSALAGRAGLAGLPAHTASEAGLLAYGASLRYGLAAANVTVSVARSGWLANRLAAHGSDLRLVALSPDRAAALIRRGIERGDRLTALPGALTIALRAVRLAPAWLREWPRRVLRQSGADAPEIGKAPLSPKSTQGD